MMSQLFFISLKSTKMGISIITTKKNLQILTIYLYIVYLYAVNILTVVAIDRIITCFLSGLLFFLPNWIVLFRTMSILHLALIACRKQNRLALQLLLGDLPLYSKQNESRAIMPLHINNISFQDTQCRFTTSSHGMQTYLLTREAHI